jgi:FkbM family methyltransferase
MGILKNDERFKFHYMVKKLIEPDYTVVDIGANLGYFSRNFSDLVKTGKVISIEPVRPFFETLQYFIGGRKNVTLHNYALGQEEGTITMVMPTSNGMMRTGLPHIAESEEEKQQHRTHAVQIKRPSELLKDITKIDYIKCDIEGYERTVFEEMKHIVEKHLPIIQIEIDPKNREFMFSYFAQLGYTQYGITNFKIVKEVPGKQQEQGDYIFVPTSAELSFETQMKAKGAY